MTIAAMWLPAPVSAYVKQLAHGRNLVFLSTPTDHLALNIAGTPKAIDDGSQIERASQRRWS
jgi:hypothetical protein